MNKIKLPIVAAVAAAIVAAAGCQTRATATKNAETALPIYTLVQVGTNVVPVVTDYKVLSGGYEITARSPLWASEALNGLTLDIGNGENHVSFGLAGYNRDLSTNSVAMVDRISGAVYSTVGTLAAAYANAQSGGAASAVSSLGTLTIAQAVKAVTSSFASTNSAATCTGTNCTTCTNCTPSAQ